ncbi:MAG: glycosyltransferase family 2 protein [Clostridia bacterium]|nr:glycosyltransferase family 2 protein [Clostridia bacterium]
MTLSVCLIVKDEQKVLKRCLNCVSKFADEIVIVDTGSTDKTVKIAKEFTDKVYFFKWCDDFSAARNYAFDMATCDLLMWLDADDIITEENCVKINELKNSFDGFDMAVLPYAAAFDGEKPTFVYNRERIFKRDKGYRFLGEVHEAVVPCGNIYYSDAVICHKKEKENEPLRNLRILQRKIASGKALDGREKFYYGRELLFNRMYKESIAVLEDFLRGNGWFVNKAEACINLYQAYKALGEDDKAISALLHSLAVCPPNSQVCCMLGEYFFNRGELNFSIYWYEAALKADNGEKSGSFINTDYCAFIPYMQLCVLYDRLGDRKKAYECNLKAGEIKPHNENYLSNVKYFGKLGF